MISVAEATRIVQAHWPPAHSSKSATALAVPEYALSARPLIADRDYPPYDRATMDGICVAWSTFAEGVREFKLVGVCAAGSEPQKLNDPAGAFEIMTGAAVPERADLVIPYEHLEIDDGRARVSVEQERRAFENVHRRGTDCKSGETIVPAGSWLKGPEWGVAASFGFESVPTQYVRIQIVSTGDELVEVGAKPLAHQIRRSNAHALRATLLQAGYRDVTLAHCHDDLAALKAHYEHAAAQTDLLIYSGGVSKGKFDFLPRVFREMGVTQHFHEVRQRPGKPLWFGTDEARATTVVGLPGNPVSSLVTLNRYFLPRRPMFARLTQEVVFDKNLTFFAPAKIEMREDGTVWATPMRLKNSGEFTALAGTDGFLELPPEPSVFREGEAFPFFSWSARAGGFA